MTVPAGVHDAFDLVEERFNQALDESLGPARFDRGRASEAVLLRIEKFVALYATVVGGL